MNFTQRPYLVSNAGNPMRYTVFAGSSAAVKAKIEIAITDVDTTADHTAVVEILGVERTFTLKAAPTDDAHLPIAEAGQTVASWADSIHQRLLHSTLLTTYYTITLDTDTNIITIEAIDDGTDYNMDVGAVNIVGIDISASDAMPPSMLSADKVTFEVRDSASALLGENLKFTDSAGMVRFDAQEYVFAKLMDFTPPRFTLNFSAGTWSKLVTAAVVRYRAGVAPWISGVKQAYMYDTWKYAISAGLSRELLTYYNAAVLDFWTVSNNITKFLTWMPNPKITDVDSPERLFFFFKEPVYTKYVMKVRGYYTDGYFNLTAVAQTTITPYSIVEFCCGFNELSLADQVPSETITSYRVWLENENGMVISEVRLFTLDRRYREYTRRFIFANSMGGYDFIRAWGRREAIIEHDRTTAMFVEESAETYYNAIGRDVLVEESQLYKASSGWITARDLDYLRDFLRSTEAYELVGTQLFRIQITGKKSWKKKDQDNNYELIFEYTRAYADQFYSSNASDMISIKDDDLGVVVDAGGITEDTTITEAVPAGRYLLKTISFRNWTGNSGQLSGGSVPGGNDLFSQLAINPLDAESTTNPEGWTTVTINKVVKAATASAIYINAGQNGDTWNGMELDIYIKSEAL